MRAIVVAALLWGAGLAQAEPVVLHDADVAIDRTLVIGTEATLYAAVRGATSLDDSQPVAGASVEAALTPARQPRVELGRGTTGADGQVVLRFRVPRIAAGDYDLAVQTRSPNGVETIVRRVTVAEQLHVHLRSDRAIYRPGQPLRWRVALQNGADAHPVADLPVEVAVADPRGTEIWRGRVSTGRTGMAAGSVPLAEDLLLGAYTLRATAGGQTSSETIDVRAFELPPFFVRIEADRPGPLAPGARFDGHVVAQLPYGEPVQGKVSVRIQPGAGLAEETSEGELDAHGRFPLSFDTSGEGDVTLQAWVTDGADRRGKAALTVPRPGGGIEIAFIPEGTRAAPGSSLAVTVVTSDGRGALLPAQVFVKVPGLAQRLAQLSRGATRLSVPIPARAVGTLRLEASAVGSDGRVAAAGCEIEVAADQPRALRVADAVVAAGQPVEVAGDWSAPTGPLVATLLRHGAPLATTLATVDGGGHLRAVLRPPVGTFGLATVRVVELAWDRKDGKLAPILAHAPIYLAPAALDVKIDAELRHKPGSDTELAVSVRDAAGKPAAGVGLAASVVDERILALGKPRPDLPSVLRSLGLEDAEAAGVVFADLARNPDATSRAAVRAIVEALPPQEIEPFVRLAAAQRVAAELARAQKVRAAVYDAIVLDPAPLGARASDGTWEFARPLPEYIGRTKLPVYERSTPWRVPTEWTYIRRLLPDFTFAEVAPRVAGDRLDQLQDLLYKRRGALRARLHRDPGALGRVIPPHLVLDPWGSPLVARVSEGVDILSAGPDGKLGNEDDLSRSDVFREYTLMGNLVGTGYGYGSADGLAGRSARSPQVMLGQASPGPEAAIRERFDETVLWVAGVETDAAGRATLPVPLADSITGWEVAVEAVGPEGAVGAAKGRLETFLPLHLDADTPVELTVGDAYTVPVIVSNHTEKARKLAVTLDAEAGLSRAGAARRELELPSGATTAVYFPLTATEAGTGRVLVQLHEGSAALDAVRRTVRVEPPGARVRDVTTGGLRDGAGKLAFEVPRDAAPASASGRLRLFRGAMDQSLDGLEGMLREPHGCFEQTSSTTYPNLLVLSLLPQGGDHAAARDRAYDYVGKGYQRLISYEVPGGGFSWFGEKPANQVLTAYGLLEFADMAKVYPVDEKMVKRTRDWLLAQQKPDGSWRPDEHWLHDWSEVQGRLSTTAWLAWTLAESGYRGAPLDRALAFLRGRSAALAADPYLLALWAAAETARGGKAPAAAGLLRARLAREPAGSVVHAGPRTLFDASGRGADVQVTALAATVFARAAAPADARATLAWLWSARHPNFGWGSTQGNVLALRAAAIATPPAPPPRGAVRVRLDGREVGAVDLASVDVPSLELPSGLSPGAHTLELSGDKGLALDSELRLAWRTAASPPASAHGLEVTLTAPAEPIALGDAADFEVKLRNPAKETISMPTVVVPVPPGFRADRASLGRLVRDHRIARFEDQGSEVHLYLTRLGPFASATLAYRLEAAAECKVTQRPVQAYAYYDTDVRGASAGAVISARR